VADNNNNNGQNSLTHTDFIKIWRLLFLSLLLLTFGSCTKNPLPLQGFSIPAVTDDGWEVTSLNAQNIDVSQIAEAEKVLKNDPSFVNIHTLTIARNGKLVLDEFYHTGPFGYHKGDLTTMQSVTKSFASFAVGIAIDRGLIKDVNQPAQSLLPGLKNIDWSTGKDKIILEHILTMSAGFSGAENTDSLLASNFAQYMFSKPLIHTPGTTFDYRTALTNPLGNILTTAISPLHTNLETYMDSLLFQPLDIKNYEWYYKSKEGEPELGGGLFLSPRDMIKLGQLVLDNGKWHNRQIVSKNWIAEATKEHFHFDKRYWGEMDGYGYLFWQRKLISQGETFSADIALGYGGQYVVIIPALNTVIAITSWFPKDKNWQFPLRLIEQYILPALKK